MRDKLQRNRAHIAAALMVCVMVLGFTACEENRYRQASAAANNFSFGLATAQDVEIVFHNQGKVSDEEHVAIQKLFKEAAQTGEQLVATIDTARKNQDVLTSLNVATQSLTVLLDEGVLHIKNEEAKASISVAIGIAKTALATIQALGK